MGEPSATRVVVPPEPVLYLTDGVLLNTAHGVSPSSLPCRKPASQTCRVILWSGAGVAIGRESI